MRSLCSAPHIGDSWPQSSLTGAADHFYYSATLDSKTRVLHVKLVNAGNSAQPLTISLDGKAHKATIDSLHGGSFDATNSITEPEAILPKRTTEAVPSASWKHTVPALTIQVIDIPLT